MFTNVFFIDEIGIYISDVYDVDHIVNYETSFLKIYGHCTSKNLTYRLLLTSFRSNK